MTNNNIYCTYVTFYSGDKLPPFYIGSTSIKKIASGYHGSVCSKKWKQIYKNEIENNPSLFDTEIINTFTNRQEALADELELQKSNDAVKSSWFFNESFAVVNGFFGRDISGPIHWNYGGKGTFTGKHHTTEHKQRMSDINKKPRPNQRGKKRPDQAAFMQGRKLTQEQRAQIKNTRAINKAAAELAGIPYGNAWRKVNRVLNTSSASQILIEPEDQKNCSALSEALTLV